MRVLKSIFVCFVAVTACLAMLSACKSKKSKPKAPPLSAKSKLLMGKSWKYDAEAARTSGLKAAGKATGIKNLGKIKLKKDVKKMADYLSAKKLYFWVDKKKGRLSWMRKTGKGFLSSKVTGWVKWNSGETMITLQGWGKRKGKDEFYKIKVLTPKKLVWLKVGAKVPQFWTR